MVLTFSAAELEELSLYLDRVADWLEEDCTARHAGDMAGGVRKAILVIDDLWGVQFAAEEHLSPLGAKLPPD